MTTVYVDCPEEGLPTRGLLSEKEYESINWHIVASLIRERNFQGIPPEILDILADKIDPEKHQPGRPPTQSKHLKAQQIKQFKKMKRDNAILKCFEELQKQGTEAEPAKKKIADAIGSMGVKNVDSIIVAQRKLKKLLKGEPFS